MLTHEERQYLKRSRFARDYELEMQFEVVTTLYPAQRLTTYINSKDIINILNCTHNEAFDLLNHLGMKKRDGIWHIRTSVFCDFFEIDEMLIQVFLASLSLSQASSEPKNKLPALTREQIAAERPRLVFETIKLLQDGFFENTKTLALRAKIYDEKNPLGEPMCKRVKWVQMVIRAYEVAQIYKCTIRHAQNMLREVREDDRSIYPLKKQRRYVSIKRFCEVHNEDEGDLRKHLAELHGPDDDEDYD
jgi:hypothetical protein